jgi:NAD(P)-dependent dehydrogenase (short-subunit alcohol dehydrogenase family)
VILGSRDAKRGEEAVSDLIRTIGGNCHERIELCVLDTSSDTSVKEAAMVFEKKFGTIEGTLYGIINNAGVRISTT